MLSKIMRLCLNWCAVRMILTLLQYHIPVVKEQKEIKTTKNPTSKTIYFPLLSLSIKNRAKVEKVLSN